MNNSEFFMKEEGMEPLSVVLVWNETDQASVEKYIQYTTKMLSRDINRPFSRTIIQILKEKKFLCCLS